MYTYISIYAYLERELNGKRETECWPGVYLLIWPEKTPGSLLAPLLWLVAPEASWVRLPLQVVCDPQLGRCSAVVEKCKMHCFVQ